MLGSRRSCLVPFAVLSATTTCEMVLPYPLSGFSVSAGVNSVTSPSYTSLVSLTRRPGRGEVTRARKEVSLALQRGEGNGGWGGRRTDGAAEVLHEDFGLLDLGAEDLAADHGAEGDLVAEFLSEGEGEGRLARARCAGEEERAAREAPRADEFEYETACLCAVPGGWGA